MDFTECAGAHAPRSSCWRCSDRLPWWRAARIKAGLGAEPPFAHPNEVVRAVPTWGYNPDCDCRVCKTVREQVLVSA